MFSSSVLKIAYVFLLITNVCFGMNKKICKLNKNLINKNHNLKCFGKLSFQCTLNHCTLDKQTCSDLLYYKLRIRNSLFDDFQSCSQTNNENFVGENVCIRETNCSYWIKSIRDAYKSEPKKKCPCNHDFPFKCDQNYCANSVKACKQLKINNNLDQKIKTCKIFSDKKNKNKLILII